MDNRFNSDPFPGRPRILFIGLGENSHTHSWIDLLDGAEFNVRLFSMPTGSPPDDWSIRTYVSCYHGPRERTGTRTPLYPANGVIRFAKRQTARAFGMADVESLAERWLAKILQEWQPDIVHTLGLVQGGEFYLRVRRRFGLERTAKWVLQTRGGSDLPLTHLDPERRKQLEDILGSCDQLICDNETDLDIARELGVPEAQLATIAPVPGTGGIDIEPLRKKWLGATSSRRSIVWPKAYDSAWGKMLPTFEALKMVWDKIQPCEIHMLSMNAESNLWYWSLPEEIRRSCRPSKRLARAEVLELLPKARVMLAPTLLDGIPNSLYEAMACGAFPILSPIDSILPVVKNEENVLFARNLYPNEIADALARAMTDDALVDAAAQKNLELVRRIASRDLIRPRVIEFYEHLTKNKSGRGLAPASPQQRGQAPLPDLLLFMQSLIKLWRAVPGPVQGVAIKAVQRNKRLYRWLLFRHVDAKDRANGGAVNLPPAALRYRVSSSPDAQNFINVGKKCANDIESALRKVGYELAAFQRILDFGCGCGRTLMHLKDLARGAQFDGTDIDEDAIDWCKQNLRFATFKVGQPSPPTDYPPDSFDFIYAISVFTHLDEDYQFRWLEELRRISTRGAVLLLTIDSSLASEKDFVFQRSYEDGLFPAWYQNAFHSEKYVRENFGKYFEVLGYLPKGMNGHQDVVVLRKS